MNEKPILFSAPMVRAILEGRKTQTRRVVKFKNHPIMQGATGQAQEHYEMKAVYPMPKGGFVFWSGDPGKDFSDKACADSTDGLRCPYGEAGNHLWVRETWAGHSMQNNLKPTEFPVGYPFIYRADIQNNDSRQSHYWWRPSIFMPRWASRITLEIVNVRVARVQEINAADILAEGINAHFAVRKTDPLPTSRSAFAKLWDTINKKRGFGWDVNPWVWVLEFKRIQ